MRKEVFYGIIAGLGLLVAYIGLLYGLNGAAHVAEQFAEFGLFIGLLSAGFGIQVGLFTYGRAELKNKTANGQMAATGGVCAGSMLACCVHHITDVAPFLGLSGFFLFASEYTGFFMILGILSNAVGITMMLSMLSKHGIFPVNQFKQTPWTQVRNLTAVFAVIALAGLVMVEIWVPSVTAQPQVVGNGLVLSSQSDARQNIEVKVTPRISANQTAFEISFTTHSGSMDFKVNDIAVLADSAGKTYRGTWTGSPPGGHHRQGTLVFESLPENAQAMRLTLEQIGGVDRVFEWNLTP